MLYVLGHRPDEFGLVPDAEGFVPLKELLKALHEEPEGRAVSAYDIQEVLIGKDRGLFDRREGLLRVMERQWEEPAVLASDDLPTLLLAPVRARAHGTAMQHGLKAPDDAFLPLTADPEQALRIGRRRDPHPVLLEVHAQEAARRGTPFYGFGSLYLVREIPAAHITGPPIVSVPEEDRRSQRPAPAPAAVKPPPTPGTFVLDLNRDPDPSRRPKGRKAKGWKEDARRLRQRKGG